MVQQDPSEPRHWKSSGKIRIYRWRGLAAGSNAALMEKQIREFMPKLAVMWSEAAAGELKVRVADLPVRILHGMDGLLELAEMEGYEILVTAVVGMIGIRPTIAAIESGKTIALANKETLVTAGASHNAPGEKTRRAHSACRQ